MKRKFNVSATKRVFKKVKGTKKSLKRTNYTGDIIPLNLHTYGASSVNPTRTVRAVLRNAFSGIQPGIVAGVGTSYAFTLNAAVGAGDYTNLYDQYRINAIEITFMPYFNEVLLSANLQGRLFSAIDYDDASTPSNANGIRNYPSCVITQSWEKCVRTFVPRVADALYSGAFTSFGNQAGQWIDSASPSVQHYGVHTWAEPSAVTSSSWYVEAKLFVEFRSTRAL